MPLLWLSYYNRGEDKMIYIGMRLKGLTVVEIKTAPGYVSRYADPEQQPLKYSPVKNRYYVECNNPNSNRYLLRAYLE